MESLTSPEGSLGLALVVLALVLGFRFSHPERGREWGAFATFAGALGVTFAAERGLLPGPVAVAPSLAIRLAGGGLLVGGLAFAGAAWKARRTTPAGQLTTGGPYARVRHPLYVGLALVLLGYVLRAPSPAGAAAVALALALHVVVAAREERATRRVFGAAWDSYAAATPAVLPSRRRSH